MSAAATEMLVKDALRTCGLAEAHAAEMYQVLGEEDLIGSASDIFNAIEGHAELNTQQRASFSETLFVMMSRETGPYPPLPPLTPGKTSGGLPHQRSKSLSSGEGTSLSSRSEAIVRAAAVAAAFDGSSGAAPLDHSSSAGEISVGEISVGEISVLDQIGWKREFKSAHERFCAPYIHTLTRAGCSRATLTLAQEPFGPEGFASTVWDSSIVLAKAHKTKGCAREAPCFQNGAQPPTLPICHKTHPFPRLKAAERWHANGTHKLSRMRCVELGAGCGLVGFVFSLLGARATLTDLPGDPISPICQKSTSFFFF